MSKDQEKKQKIQELQILEQNLQNIFYQKQSFQIEISEVKAALKELKNSEDEVFKIVGQLMIKSDKEKIKKELEKKKEFLEKRIEEIDKQEEILNKKLDSLRQEIL